MIGQVGLKQDILTQIEHDTFPRFSILVGPHGSGKKLMCRFISTHLNAHFYPCNIGVDDIRHMIVEAHKVASKVLFVIADADKMSQAAKNALLKVTEEPPQNAYFVMTLTDINNTLGTIKSRGTVFYMDKYSVSELYDYAYSLTNSTLHAEEFEVIKNICETPGEINILAGDNKMGILDFYNYVEKVVDNIAVVSGSNSFKVGNKIAFKDSDVEKFNLKLFWKAFMSICVSRLREDPLKYSKGVQITSKYLQDLRIKGINKQSTFDMWVLDIRQEWM